MNTDQSDLPVNTPPVLFAPRRNGDHLLLAPMVGLSNRPLRSLVFGFGGLDFCFTEMASAGGFLAGSMEDSHWMDTRPEPARTGIQFFTIKPEHLQEACRRVAAFPEETLPRALDINFACSAPHIRKAGGGSDWMKRPDEAAGLIASIRPLWPGLLSAKIRLGTDYDYGRLLDFCRNIHSAGIDMLTLHPRLDSQKFRRESKREYIARLSADLAIPVFGNGDVRTVADWRSMRGECGCAGIMIGREAIRRPWIFALIRGTEHDPGFVLEVDRETTALRFLDLCAAHLPQAMGVKAAQSFFLYYCDTLSFAHHLKWKLANTPDYATMRVIILDYFQQVPQDRILVQRQDS